MAFDAVPGGDPRGPVCPKCRRPVLKDQPSTRMVFPDDPDGLLGKTGQWHGECARPHWDTLTPVLQRLSRLPGG
jgi:hypothetical protein